MRDRRASLLVAFVTIAVSCLLAAPLGLAWAALAPRAALVVTGHGTALANPESETLFAVDGWFAVVTAAAGIVSGVVCQVLAGRRHGLAALLALTLGGLLGALLTWRVGHVVDSAAYREAIRSRPVGAHLPAALTLRATAAVVLWPLAAVLAFGLLDAGVYLRERARRPDLIVVRSGRPPHRRS